MPIQIESDDAYHAGPGVSKSGLWKLWSKTPYHFRFGKHENKPAFDIGKAAHIAILEPDTLEMRVTKGPADRRGNKWKEAQDFAEHSQTILLTESDYEMAMLIRDLAETSEHLRLMRSGDPIVETSAYHIDEEHDVLVKCRPDIFSRTHKIGCDIKNMADASPSAFERDVGKFGYNMQDAVYTDIWSKGSGYEMEAFFFIVFEKSEPPMVAVYELDANAVAEGHAIYRAALARYAECLKADRWPGYSQEVQRISMRKWDYKLTQPEEET